MEKVVNYDLIFESFILRKITSWKHCFTVQAHSSFVKMGAGGMPDKTAMQ